MANLFESVMGNLNDVQQDLLGPDYQYWKQVKSPSEIGMSGDGLGALSRDVAGLIDYVEILVAGGGGASKVNSMKQVLPQDRRKVKNTVRQEGRPVYVCEQCARWPDSLYQSGHGWDDIF